MIYSDYTKGLIVGTSMGLAVCALVFVVGLAITQPSPVVKNQHVEDGIPVVNCKHNQVITDLDYPNNNDKIVGVVINGYCPESDYDIVLGNEILELQRQVDNMNARLGDIDLSALRKRVIMLQNKLNALESE
jgi:hypothetical protein